MSIRIQKIFQNKNKKLITFTTGGDPNLKTSIKVIETILDNGADIIEIGMPFSDPMADGPTIQLSSNRAIAKGTTLEEIFFICNQVRKKSATTPIILMGYYNLIYHYGISEFVKRSKESNVDGLIIVDLQPEEDSELIDKILSLIHI